MKACFLIPPPLPGARPAERVFGCTYELYPFPPLPILYAAAAARRAGHVPEVVDAVRAGHLVEDFDGEFLRKAQADCFVFHTVNLSREADKHAHAKIREFHGLELPVVFTGPGPTWEPERYALDPHTFVLRGEVEESLPELLSKLATGKPFDPAELPGLTARAGDGRILSGPPRPAIEDLDKLPFPARDLVDRDAYFNPKLGARPCTAVLTSRGCPHRCRYCVPCAMSFARELEGRRVSPDGKKPPVRLRSAGNVIAELEQLAKEGYRAISFIDDEFVWSAERTEELCAAVGRLGFRWGCLARPDYLDERSVAALAKARCRYVDLGAESFVQAILDDIGKDLKIADAERAVRLLKTAGVPVKLNVLIGASVLETRETIEETIRKTIELDPDAAMFGVCNPFPGTPYWDYAAKQGLLTGPEYRPVDVQRESSVRLPHLSPEELVAAVRRANRRFYLRPRVILRNVFKSRSLGDLLRGAGAFWRKMRP
jgi:radical SAM superfamily enzyme YgiQ (UPF0313 family)